MDEVSMSNFINECLTGDAFLDDIDDYIDNWHQDDGGLSLYDFLGMTRSEYSLWVQDPSCLPFIVHARFHGRELTDASKPQTAPAIAARSDRSSEITSRLLEWLKDRGLWD